MEIWCSNFNPQTLVKRVFWSFPYDGSTSTIIYKGESDSPSQCSLIRLTETFLRLCDGPLAGRPDNSLSWIVWGYLVGDPEHALAGVLTPSGHSLCGRGIFGMNAVYCSR
jgi:hypothetical protein